MDIFQHEIAVERVGHLMRRCGYSLNLYVTKKAGAKAMTMTDWDMMRYVRDAYWKALEHNDPAAAAEAVSRASDMGFGDPEQVGNEIVEAYGARRGTAVRGTAALG